MAGRSPQGARLPSEELVAPRDRDGQDRPQLGVRREVELVRDDLLGQGTVCLCPTTERDLADGVGPARRLADAGAGLSLGSDSNALIDPFEEARAVELGQRLVTGERGIHAPEELLLAATADGHACLGWPEAGRIEVGAPADLVTVGLDRVGLAGTDPARAIGSVVFAAGSGDVREVIVPCAEDLDLLAAGSGVPRMAELSAFELHLIATGLSEVETEYGYLLVDSAAGISRQTVSFAAACDLVLVVTTPDLTAMTDAYALLKVLYAKHPECRPLLLVNRAGGDQEAHDVAERIARVCTRFMGSGPRFLGWLPDDRTVTSCVNRRAAVVLLEPEAPFGQALAFLQERIFSQLELHPGGGVGRRLLQEIGYSPGMG